jgi:lipoprotein-anchoring transpeptidase ErfK/SrfK
LPHVLVDLDARWMLFFLGENVVCSYPVGIGRQGSETPVGTYKVGEKTSEPTWFPPGAAPVPFNDPRNPLGTRWMAWQSEAGVNTSLGFHGTREPSSIGQQGSEGCIRLLNSDVEELFDLLPRGTEVRVQS